MSGANARDVHSHSGLGRVARMSTSRVGVARYALFVAACLHVTFCSGIAYGWTALRPVLVDAGFFADRDARSREDALHLVGTLGVSANALCKLPLGIILDKGGQRLTALIGAAMMVSGSLLLAVGSQTSLWQVSFGYTLIGVSGPFLQMPCFRFCELFSARSRGTAMSVLVTCFELSTGVFYVCKRLHETLGVGATAIFLSLSVVGAFAGVSAFMCWPHGRSSRLSGAAESRNLNHVDNDAGPSTASGRRVAAAEQESRPPLHVQLRSADFAYATLFLAVHIFRQGFILVTVGPRNEALFNPTTAGTLSDAFSLILPLGFVPMALLTCSGIAGALLAKPTIAFVLVSVLSIVYGVLLVVPLPSTFIISFFLFPIARQLVFSCFFSFTANAFGYARFGRINGVSSTIAGLLQLLQAPLITAVESGASPGSPLLAARWAQIDTALALLPAILLLRPAYLMWGQARRRHRARELSGGEMMLV